MDHGHRQRFGRPRNDVQQHSKRMGIPTDRESEATTFSSRLTVALVGA
jgi:hypothetical protein